MASNFNPILCATDPFKHIIDAYYKNGQPKTPSNEELKTIEADTAGMGLTGKVVMGGSFIAGTGLSVAVWGIPYVGPFLSLVTGITSFAAGVIGYDIHTASQNLQTFANKQHQIILTNVVNALLGLDRASKKEFEKDMLNAATKGTIIARMIYDGAVASKHL